MKKLINIAFVMTAFVQLSAQKIIHQEIFSPKMNKKIKTVIITPNLQPDMKYPSVYILHGFSGNPDRIIKQDIPDLVKKFRNLKPFMYFLMAITVRGT
ncbi:hypothetical protein OWR28_11890 [Chryseobacterium sp. 1B4]